MNINKLLKIALIIAILVIAGSIFYRYVVYLPQRFIPKEEKSQQDILKETILERFNSYSGMISVKLCKEAYDEFITKGLMERKGYEGFLAHCNYRGTNWSNIQIQNVVLSDEDRADIKYTYDLSSPDLNSQEYKNCMKDLFPEFCYNSAPRKIVKDEWVETWLLEDGKWKRDY